MKRTEFIKTLAVGAIGSLAFSDLYGKNESIYPILSEEDIFKELASIYNNTLCNIRMLPECLDVVIPNYSNKQTDYLNLINQLDKDHYSIHEYYHKDHDIICSLTFETQQQKQKFLIKLWNEVEDDSRVYHLHNKSVNHLDRMWDAGMIPFYTKNRCWISFTQNGFDYGYMPLTGDPTIDRHIHIFQKS